jgi:hypothetical protein
MAGFLGGKGDAENIFFISLAAGCSSSKSYGGLMTQEKKLPIAGSSFPPVARCAVEKCVCVMDGNYACAVNLHPAGAST